MSFQIGSSSGSLSFSAARYNVTWDGVSQAKASFELACHDTAASYSAVSYPVFATSGEISHGCGSNPVAFARGQRAFEITGCNGPVPVKSFSPDVSLPTTVAASSISILFSAITNTNFTSTHAWKLTATKSGVTRVLLAGQLLIKPFSPFDSGGSSVSLVGGVTASGCF